MALFAAALGVVGPVCKVVESYWSHQKEKEAQNRAYEHKESELRYKEQHLQRSHELAEKQFKADIGFKAVETGMSVIGAIGKMAMEYNASSEKRQQEVKAAISNMQKEHEKEMKRYEKEREKKEQEKEAAYKQQLSQKENEMRAKEAKMNQKFEKMDLNNQLSEKIKDEMHYNTQISQLLDQREMLRKQAMPLYKKRWDIDIKYKILNERICIEKELIKKFQFERDNNDYQLLVALGCVGVGKSTFCRRFIGDTSKYGRTDNGGNNNDNGNNNNNNDNNGNNNNYMNDDSEEGDDDVNIGYDCSAHEIEVGTGIKACTQDISKFGTNVNCVVNGVFAVKNISIVDAPGAEDGDGKDAEHGNNLAAYLRGCGGVNAFLVFFNCVDRAAQWYFGLLKKYEDMMGKEFWKHVIIIATKADMQRSNGIDCSSKEWKDVLRKEIQTKIGIKVDLPVIVTGHGRYGDAVNELMVIIPQTKYNCEAIKSPIDDLYKELKGLAEEKNNLETHLETIFSDCGEIDGKIKCLNNNLNDIDKDIRNLQECLGKPARKQKVYDYESKLVPLNAMLNSSQPGSDHNNNNRKDKPKNNNNNQNNNNNNININDNGNGNGDFDAVNYDQSVNAFGDKYNYNGCGNNGNGNGVGGMDSYDDEDWQLKFVLEESKVYQ